MSESLTDRRARLMGAGAPLFYDDPVHLVRGEGVWLWDAAGRRYLDAYNNVPCVGHGHPRVVEAVRRQMAALNTHNRYLHPLALDLIERLGATLGHGLGQAVLVNSGSEAGDVALRMAQAATGRRGIIAVQGSYHGNTAALLHLTADRTPAATQAAHVRLVPAPDPLRAGDADPDEQARRFARDVALAIADLEDTGIGFAAMILCPFFANEGFPAVQPGFLAPAEAVIRRAGGLIIADEVQAGFGRLGSDFWGHQRLGVVPDVVMMGKAMGNGYPVAAAFTRPEVMEAFRHATRFFSTFGGNPVAAAAALATFDVLEEEGLQRNAAEVGEHLAGRLRALRHPLLAEVRGAGLFLGMEFAAGERMAPQAGIVARLVEGLRDEGVLCHTTGAAENILKIRPPLPFSREDADHLAETLGRLLARIGDDP